MSDPMLYGITRYAMLVEVDYMGFGAGIAAEPNPDGGWINAAQTPRHQRYILQRRHAAQADRTVHMRHIVSIGTVSFTQADWNDIGVDEVLDLVVQRFEDYPNKTTVFSVDLVAKSKTEYSKYGWVEES
jgi:hypothetical protein